MMALLMLAACEQAERAVGSAVGPRKAIAELQYAGDRPDVPPLEERGNAQFTSAAYDDTGTLLITQSWFGSARLQVWNAADGTVAVCDTATDTIRFPLKDSKRKPLPYPMQR